MGLYFCPCPKLFSIRKTFGVALWACCLGLIVGEGDMELWKMSTGLVNICMAALWCEFLNLLVQEWGVCASTYNY